MKTLLSLLMVICCSTVQGSEGKEITFQSVNLHSASFVLARVTCGKEKFDLVNFFTVAEARKAAASYVKRFPSATGVIVEIYDQSTHTLTFEIKRPEESAPAAHSKRRQRPIYRDKE